MGAPVTCEFVDPSGSGDVIQETTLGLAIRRQGTLMSLFTDGNQHWALAADALLTWTGESIDPTADAVVSGGNPECAQGGCMVVAAPAPTFSTRNGSKTEQQLRDELAAAGYGGPWDVSSMLAAYGAANAPVPTPVVLVAGVTAAAPAKPDFNAACEASANSLPSKIGNRVVLRSNMVLNCLIFAEHYGQQGVDCHAQVVAKEATDLIIYSVDDLISRVQDCVAGR
jgi:hypothetical protein